MSDKTMSNILKVLFCLTLEGDVAIGLRDYLISISVMYLNYFSKITHKIHP